MAGVSAGSAPRAQWKAVIEVGGGMTIPVKLYSAVRPQSIHFRMLHDQDHTPVRQVMECPAEGKEVPREHIVKGFEIRKDQYVIVSDEEMDQCGPVASRTIAVHSFVDADEIDPVFFEKANYLGPDTGGQKGYAALVHALDETGKVAIAEYVLRGRQYLAAIRPYQGRALCLESMRYADEVVPVEELARMAEDVDRSSADLAVGDVGKARGRARRGGADGGGGTGRGAPNEREVAMAQQLVESLAAEFDPTQYHDEYRACVMEMIERKAAGQKVTLTKPKAKPATKAQDLTDILAASLEHVRGRLKKGA